MEAFEVTIAGELNMDLVLYGLPEQMPTERELLATDFRATLGSSSAIAAHNLAKLGVSVGFISRIGCDEFGRMALDRLREAGVDVSRVVRSEESVSTGITVLLHHGERRHIVTYPGTMATMARTDLDFDYLASAKHFHLSSLFLHRALLPDLPMLFRDLKHAGLTISLDTNDDPEDRWEGVLPELLPYVDVLLPNAHEACCMAQCANVQEAVRELGRRVPCVAVKNGPRGALLYSGGTLTEVPPIAVQPMDTIGAGDSFNAGFLSGYIRGASLEECCRRGNASAALSTLRSGGTEAFRDSALREEFLGRHFPGWKSTA